MNQPKQSRMQRLERTVSLLQGRYGERVVQKAREMPKLQKPPRLTTGFVALDALTGCAGVPLGALTVLAGATTSGKLTLGYKILANAQHSSARRKPVAILDLTASADADYVARCGIDLQHALFVRPAGEQTLSLVFDLIRDYGLRAVLIDGLADLLTERAIVSQFDALLPKLTLQLKTTPCALICLDEPQPPWARWLRFNSGALPHCAQLHLELKREKWLERQGEVVGYSALAHLVKSHWAPAAQAAPVRVEFVFNGTVHARETW